MIKYFETEKGYKRVKTSLYLKKSVYDRLDEISKENELSLSECGQRLLQKGMGGVL
jgi:hypothetical protein